MGDGAEKFAFYSAGREESKNTYGFKSLGCKLLFSLQIHMSSPVIIFFFFSSHHLIVKKPYISDPRAPASAVWVLCDPPPHPGMWAQVSWIPKGLFQLLTSLLNIVIELRFLTVAGSVAKDCITVRDCGFDCYVFLLCRVSASLGWRSLQAHPLGVFIFSSLGNCKMGGIHLNAARLISSQLQTG